MHQYAGVLPRLMDAGLATQWSPTVGYEYLEVCLAFAKNMKRRQIERGTRLARRASHLPLPSEVAVAGPVCAICFHCLHPDTCIIDPFLTS